MHGDYEEMEPVERGGWDWQSGCLVSLLILFVVFSWVVSGCSAQGAELPAYQVTPDELPAYQVTSVGTRETPAAGVGGGGGIGSTPPPVLLGWNYTRPDGTTYFVPATSPVVPEPIRPFVPPPGTGAITAPTIVRSVGGLSTSSPAPVRDRIRTGMFVLPGIRGGIENCGPLG